MFSKDLEVSIANLFDKAQEINIQYLTVEHLFLMILNDFDVKDFIEAQNVSVDVLKDEPAIDICIGRKNEDINNINQKTAAAIIDKVINSDKEGSYISAVVSLIDGDLDPIYELNKVSIL